MSLVYACMAFARMCTLCLRACVCVGYLRVCSLCFHVCVRVVYLREWVVVRGRIMYKWKAVSGVCVEVAGACVCDFRVCVAGVSVGCLLALVSGVCMCVCTGRCLRVLCINGKGIYERVYACMCDTRKHHAYTYTGVHAYIREQETKNLQGVRKTKKLVGRMR